MALGLWNRVTGFVFGGAIAGALSRALEAVLEPVRQHAWERNTVRVLGAGTLAELLAKGIVPEAELVDEAKRTGYASSRLRALAALAQSFPGMSELDAMSNRELIGPELLEKALSRHGIPAEWHPAIRALFSDLLTPGELANAIHRGLLESQGLLLGHKPGTDRKVPAYPVFPIDAVKEARGNGYDRDRLGVLVGLAGLPMGPHEAAQAHFREIITLDDYFAAIAQGNTRNEWADAIMEQTRQIPTSRDFFENALRGYHDFAWAVDQAKRHGMSEADATVIYQNQGRPMNVRAITQARARGGVFKPEPGEMPDDALRAIIRDNLPPGAYDLDELRPYMAAIVEGNLKPAYYGLEYARRYNYPSAFYFRSLQQAGVIDEAQAKEYYLELGWTPILAEQVAHAYAGTKSGAAKEATATDELTLFDGRRIDRSTLIARLRQLGYSGDDANRKADLVDARRVASSRTTAVSDMHGAYKKGELTDDQATAALLELGLADWAPPAIVANWRIARDAAPAPQPPHDLPLGP